MRKFLLKSIPYLLAIAGGAALFWLTLDRIHNPDLRDLVNNIAASLLSIPLVFLLYDYSNFLISRQLARTQTDTTHDKIDSLLINIIVLLRQIMGMRKGLTLNSLNKMTAMSANEIANRLTLRSGHIKELQSYYNELDNLVYRGSDLNIFSMVQLQSLSTLTRNLLHLINVHRFHQDKRAAARYIEKIIHFVAEWVDADASASMHFQQLIDGTYDSTTGQGTTGGVTSGSMIGPRGRAATSGRKK